MYRYEPKNRSYPYPKANLPSPRSVRRNRGWNEIRTISEIPSQETPIPQQQPKVQRENTKSSFEKLRVSEVYCPTCKTARPVKEVLGYEDADVTVFHVVCEHCNSVVGQRTISDATEEAA